MNRRQAIYSMIFITSGIAVSVGGYEWYDFERTPDLKSLSANKALIAELAEIIIPTTDTPGAKAAKVDDFIIKTIIYCEDVREQNSFISGLKNVQIFSNKKFGRPFEQCLNSEKITILEHFEKKDMNSNKFISKIRVKLFGRPFFSQLKDITVYGYFTSQIGATQALQYDYIPINFEPCIPLLKNQKSWATK